jgi:hypothetical protein
VSAQAFGPPFAPDACVQEGAVASRGVDWQARRRSRACEMEAAAMSRIPRLPDTFRWRLAIGAVLIAGSYLAWLIIPLVVSSGLSPNVKTALTAVLAATPLAAKFIAVALLGRPTINYLKKHPLRLFRGKSGPAD